MMLLIRRGKTRSILFALSEQKVMNVKPDEKLKQFLQSKKEIVKKLGFNYIDTSPPSQLPSDGEHLHFNRFCFLPPPPLPPCLSRSLTLLDWTFLLQKQFSIIICNATPQCRMQMLLTLAAPAWQLPPEHRCRRPLRQNKVEGANNVITQSLHIGVHSLRAAVDSGHCWHRLGRDGDDAGCQERNARNLISASVQDSPNSRGTPAECQRRKMSRDSQVESEVWRPRSCGGVTGSRWETRAAPRRFDVKVRAAGSEQTASWGAQLETRAQIFGPSVLGFGYSSLPVLFWKYSTWCVLSGS